MLPVKAKLDKGMYVPLSSQVQWKSDTQVSASYDMRQKNLSVHLHSTDRTQNVRYDASAQDFPMLNDYSNLIVHRLGVLPNKTRDLLIILLAQKETESDTVLILRDNLEGQSLHPVALTKAGQRFTDFRLFYNTATSVVTLKVTTRLANAKEGRRSDIFFNLGIEDEIRFVGEEEKGGFLKFNKLASPASIVQ